MRRLPIIATLVAALCLALPASALAQGAGDEQYRDPFEGQPQQQQPQQEAPQAPADPAAGVEAPTAQATQTPAPVGSSQAAGELPRTGFQGIVLLLASGWALLVGGAALRRIA